MGGGGGIKGPKWWHNMQEEMGEATEQWASIYEADKVATRPTSYTTDITDLMQT